MARKIRLLIADDEQRFLKTLAARLELRGFDVTPVSGGPAALEAARGKEFDLALVDLRMPGMSGERLLEELRREQPALELIVLTGCGPADSAVQSARAGSYHYLQKPCGTEELLEALQSAHEARARRTPRGAGRNGEADEDRAERIPARDPARAAGERGGRPMNDSPGGGDGASRSRIAGAREELRVRDLMLLLSEYSTVSAEATLRDALAALSKAQMGLTYDRHHHRAVLALDERGRVVGKLSHWAILRSLEPRLLSDRELRALNRAGLSSDFIDSLRETVHFFKGSLRHMCANAGRVRVKDAMVPAGEGIDEDAPLTEAIHRMVLEHAQSILVTRQDEVIGVLRLSDVFEEVADAIREGCD